MQPKGDDQMQPERLGPYRIVGTLGRGGMGAVYSGVDVETDEPAAIKVLSASLAQEKGFRQRFEAEIDTLRKLRHPNIVRLFGFGEHDGRLFYAMELVDGESLEQELQRGRLFDWREVARIGIDTCQALRHAHDRGIIHRDIKPANLLLASDGRVRLSDFGIARLFGYSRLTAAGNVLGTIEFMAPEQADDQPAGPRADLYSLGGVLYTLLARRPPLRAKSVPKLLGMLRTARPEPVSKYAPDVPAELESMIAQLLDKDPQKRVATALVLSRRLQAMLHALSGQGQPASANSSEQTEDDFDLATRPPTPDRPEIRKLPETHFLEQVAEQPSAQDGSALDEQDLPKTKETFALAGLAAAESAPPDTVAPEEEEEEKRGGRFVAVREEDLDRFEAKEPTKGALISPQTWVLVVALVVMGLIARYFLQEPSADALYDEIVAVTAERTVASYRRAEDDILKFLKYHSDDPRRARLQGYLQEIELDKLERDLELQAKGLISSGRPVPPIERDYLQAIKYLQLDPDLGIAKLQALVDLWDSPGDPLREDPLGPERSDDISSPTGQCLALAKRRLDQLRLQRALAAPDHLSQVFMQLDEADRVDSTDPDKARQIREAVPELYSEKPWAAEAVRRAQEALGADSAAPRELGTEEPAP